MKSRIQPPVRGCTHACLVVLCASVIAASLSACRDAKPGKAAKAAAKQSRDEHLLTLTYPTSTGFRPTGMDSTYDEATDRTTTILRLSDLRASGAGAVHVASATLTLTSSHKGRERAHENPEGTIDGSFAVQTRSPGILAFVGTPGTLTVSGQEHPLRLAGKDSYTSAPASASTGGRTGQESLRFKISTEHLLAACGGAPAVWSFGTVRFELNESQAADLREFAARLNPRP